MFTPPTSLTIKTLAAFLVAFAATPARAQIFTPSLSIGANSDGTGDATGKEGESVSLTVKLDAAPLTEVTVNWRYASGGTAQSSDYSHDGGQNLTFAVGETSKTISVDLANDARHEAEEFFRVELHNPSGATISRRRVRITIAVDPDNPDLPSFSITPTLAVAEAAGTVAVSVVHNAFPSDVADITIGYQMAGVTATAGVDFTASSGTLTFPKGSRTTRTINVPILEDDLGEEDETFEVRFETPSAGEIVQDPAKTTVTILDSDATGQPTISGPPQMGETLTAGIGTIDDDDGLPMSFPGDYEFQWIRVDGTGNETPIRRAKSNTYTPVAADFRHTVKVKVTFTDGGNTEESVTSDAYPSAGAIVAPPRACPSNAFWCQTVTVMQVSGTEEYRLLTVANSLDIRSFAYNGTNYTLTKLGVEEIDGSATVVLILNAFLPHGVGLHISGHGFTTVARAETSTAGQYHWTGSPTTLYLVDGQKVNVSLTPRQAVANATGKPKISGTARIGKTLTGSIGTVSDVDGITKATNDESGYAFVYTWIRVGSRGRVEVGSGTSYTLERGDVGNRIELKVSFRDDGGQRETRRERLGRTDHVESVDVQQHQFERRQILRGQNHGLALHRDLPGRRPLRRRDQRPRCRWPDHGPGRARGGCHGRRDIQRRRAQNAGSPRREREPSGSGLPVPDHVGRTGPDDRGLEVSVL